MTVVPLPQKTATIGGSDAAAACGVDPHRSQVELWLNKRAELGFTEFAEPVEETEAMRWGSLLEPVIYEGLENELDLSPDPCDETFADPERSWLTGNPDAFLDTDEDGRWLVEIKTAGQWAAREWNGHPPAQYEAQVQHYLHLTGLDRALLAVLVGGQRLVTYELKREEAVIDRMLELEEAFYLAHLTPQTWDVPPAPDDSESAREALATMFPPRPGRLAGQHRGVVRLDAEHWAVLRELRARREQRKAVEAQERGLENRLKLLMGDAEVALSPSGNEVLTWAAVETTRLNVQRVREERPGVYELFSETTSSRRFSVL